MTPCRSYVFLLAAGILIAGPLHAETIDGWEMEIRHPVRNPETHHLLRQWIKEEDPDLRMAGLDALARIKDRADHKHMRSLLADPDGRVRTEAVRAAAQVGLTVNAAQAQKLAEDPEASVRRAFYTHIEALNTGAQASLLKQGLADIVPGVRSAAGQTAARMPAMRKTVLSMLDDETSNPVQLAWYEALLKFTPAPRTELLDWGSNKGNAFALILLEQLQEEDVTIRKTVLDWFNDPVDAIAEAALLAAGRVGWDMAVPLALDQLPDAGAMRKMSLMALLSHFERPETIKALFQVARNDKQRLVAIAAGEALSAWKSDEATERLIQLVPRGHMDVRINATRELGDRRAMHAATVLFSLLEEDNQALVEAVVHALDQLKHPDQAQHLETFRKLAQSDHGGIKAGAFRLLGQLDDREVLPALDEVLTDISAGDPYEPRLAAWEVLRQWKEDGFYDLAMEFFMYPLVPLPPPITEPSYDHDLVRYEAMRYLVDFRTSGTPQELLKNLTETPSSWLRVRLAEVLTELTGQKYIPLPNHSYESYRAESLKSFDRPRVIVPGVQLASP